MTFPTRLRELRKAKGLTLKAVSLQTGISHGYIGSCEHGLKNPGADIIKRLALAYDADPDALLTQAGKLDPVITAGLLRSRKMRGLVLAACAKMGEGR